MTGERSVAADEELAGRYGPASSGRRRVLIGVVAVIAALGVAWVLWAAASGSDRPVDAELESYEVTGDTSTEVTIVLNRRGDEPLECVVYAQAEDHSTVGELVVRVPQGNPGRLRITKTITTQRRAVNGVLRSCEAVDP